MTRILIVDDSSPARGGLRRLVEENKGWEVCGEAIDGRDAINRVRETAPDVILLDFQMPVMNGLQAAREIVKLRPGVQILLCTLHISRTLVREAQSAGIRGTVAKGESDQIVQGIEALLRHETFFDWN
jgi:DNA-binding NarL/FixJ family response regulator